MEFRVVSQTKGRIRYRSDFRFGYEAAEELADKLEIIPGIDGVEINARTGSVLLLYQSEKSLNKAEQILSKEIPVLHRKPKTIPKGTSVVADVTFWPALRHFVVGPLLPLPLRLSMFFAVSKDIFVDGFKALFKGQLTVEVLDLSAIALSLCMRDFKTAATTALLLGLGEHLEEWTKRKTMSGLTKSLALNIDTVWVKQEDVEVEVPLSSLTGNEIVICRTGSAIPVDGEIVAGEATVNQASMTGEPLGVLRTIGNRVFAGTAVEEGRIEIRPTEIGQQTRLSTIIQFIENSEKTKAGIESRVNRLADRIVPFSFLLAGITWILTRNLMKVASVLMVDYSCALKLATPIAFMSVMKEASNERILIKGGKYIEGLAIADTVVFDKTGTLTNSTPTVKEIVSLDKEWKEREILRVSACLEEHFPHPVARAVVKAAARRRLKHEEEHAEVEYIVGHGICSRLHGDRLLLGSRHYIEEDEGVDCSFAQPEIDRLAAKGQTILYLVKGDRLIGLIGVEDPIREEAPYVIQQLKEMGLHIVMITGDGPRTAAHVAVSLGIDEYYSQVLPDGKAKLVDRMEKSGKRVLMVGDGINDSPALSAATVGVTLAAGADLAREVAAVVLLGEDLTQLPTAIELGRKTYARIHENFRITVGANTTFLAGGLFGVLSPATGAVLHNLTTLGIAYNAQRKKLDAKEPLDIVEEIEEE